MLLICKLFHSDQDRLRDAPHGVKIVDLPQPDVELLKRKVRTAFTSTLASSALLDISFIYAGFEILVEHPADIEIACRTWASQPEPERVVHVSYTPQGSVHPPSTLPTAWSLLADYRGLSGEVANLARDTEQLSIEPALDDPDAKGSAVKKQKTSATASAEAVSSANAIKEKITAADSKLPASAEQGGSTVAASTSTSSDTAPAKKTSHSTAKRYVNNACVIWSCSSPLLALIAAFTRFARVATLHFGPANTPRHGTSTGPSHPKVNVQYAPLHGISPLT